MEWRNASVSERTVSYIAKELGIPRLIAQLIARLGIKETKAAKAFLHPRLNHLDDPFNLSQLEDAVLRIRQAMAGKERIVIIGDYDVDGITSTALLVHALNTFGIFPEYTVPLRLEEGYGLSCTAIDRALDGRSAGLVIAVDCGTNSIDEIRHIKSTGADVIIIDHHRSTCEEAIPAILVNPHVNDGDHEPWKHLCSVGLVFKLVHGIVKSLRDDGDPIAFKIQLKDYLDLVAMGTVADLVPLVGENRILTHRGLKMLESTRREGLHALFQVAGMQSGNPVTSTDISFKLAPRINASGRLADAELTVKMLLNRNVSQCLEMAKQLDSMNCERQDIERGIVEEADHYIETHLKGSYGFVLHNPSWHSGVVGIVAGRVSRKHNVPTIVLGEDRGFAKGSGRSVPGVNLVEVLGECSDLLESWGGHPMATGVSLEESNVDAFQKAFNQAVKRALEGDAFEPELEIAANINAEDICESFMDTMDLLHPFGQGNPEPIFGIKNIQLGRPPETFGSDHYRFLLQPKPGVYLSGVAWKKADNLPPSDQPIDIAAKINWNHFNGRRSLQLELLDWKFS
ncbi:MAG: single-stranded-DNA-specific exonuclease RecJ [Verrucomicrobia bacterium]|nr:single-stranded-DNA-specific exonuclease RecJ [Verrucomicrobiota bacterium]MDA1065182.1 single-stranded-DNA-specific exonuclease RecJ [Verrucomicrobiota bacterium]